MFNCDTLNPFTFWHYKRYVSYVLVIPFSVLLNLSKSLLFLGCQVRQKVLAIAKGKAGEDGVGTECQESKE